MNIEQAKAYLHDHATEYKGLQKARVSGYICPVCGSGSGKNGTGIEFKNGRWKCYSGNHTGVDNGDIIDLIALEHGKPIGDTYFMDNLKEACREFNITLDNEDRNPTQKPVIRQQKEIRKPEAIQTGKLKVAEKHIGDTDYPQKRGLSEKTIQRFHLGYDSAFQHNRNYEDGRKGTVPRLIIPLSDTCYKARYTGDAEKDGVVKSITVGSVDRFLNEEALQKAQKPIWIVEGEFDCLSLIEAGAEAICISGTSGVDTFEKKVKAVRSLSNNQKPSVPFVIAMDNDTAGDNASGKLINICEKEGLPYFYENPKALFCGEKDANDALIKHPEDFRKKVKDTEERILSAPREAIERTFNFSAMSGFLDYIKAGGKKYIATGFKELDKVLGGIDKNADPEIYGTGGLSDGLYVIGAVASLGKTSFMLQIADTIAKNGRAVYYYSLEMSKYQLMARSISRLTYSRTEKNGVYNEALAYRENDVLLDVFSTLEKQKNLEEAQADYINQIAPRIRIIEGMGNISVQTIRKDLEDFRTAYGDSRETPVIVIDYLQILCPVDAHASDKQRIDDAVTALKVMSRDYNTPVIAISSFNRSSYRESVTETAFKESGSVEYTSDTLIGLQYEGMDWLQTLKKDSKGNVVNDADGNPVMVWENEQEHTRRVADVIKIQKEKARNGQGQDIELKVLKNRGSWLQDVNLTFYPKYSLFEEA